MEKYNFVNNHNYLKALQVGANKWAYKRRLNNL